MALDSFTKYLCPDLSHPAFFPPLPSPPPCIPPPLQPYGSLHYRWVCLRRQGKALRVWWILYIIKLHFSSIQTSLCYKGSPPQWPYECTCEQRPKAGFFWALLPKQKVQSFGNFHKISYQRQRVCWKKGEVYFLPRWTYTVIIKWNCE